MLEKVLLSGIWTGFVLLLLMPLVVTPQTIFPFIVGKALYSRAIIEIIFGLWALLAILRPAYRPPRSWLLILLALSLGVAILAACFGVSVQRSFWSTYERMQGVVDLAHWFVFTVVVASVVRTFRGWGVLLNLNLGVSLIVALLALSQHYANVGSSLFAFSPYRESASFGNPTYLGTYMLVNVILALGFLIRSFIPAQRIGKNFFLLLWSGRCFWGGTALINIWVLILTGTRGALLGLILGLGFSAVLFVFLARRRAVRLAAIGLTGTLGGAAILIASMFLTPDILPFNIPPHSAFAPRTSEVLPGEKFLSIRGRLALWEAGVKGFVDEPFLGWGPENYIVVFGRYASGLGSSIKISDAAHGEMFEVLTTAGLFGLLSYLALWALTFSVVVRAATGMDFREQVLTLFVGATLMGHFVQSQFLFDISTTSLQYSLLLACVATLERGRRERAPARRRRAIGRHTGIRIGLGVGALALVGVGLLTNHAQYSAASAVRRMVAPTSTFDQALGYCEQALIDFKPLANYPRLVLFENAARLWPTLGLLSKSRLLALVDTEAAAAIDSEPENWRVYLALARLYGVIAASDPAYVERAIRYRDKTLELAPHRQEAGALLLWIPVVWGLYEELVPYRQEVRAVLPPVPRTSHAEIHSAQNAL